MSLVSSFSRRTRTKKITKTTRVVQQKVPAEIKPGGNTLLFGKDLSEYANIPIEDLLNQLTEEELEQLNDDVDPDDPHIPPSMRCREQTKKTSTGPLDRQKLLSYLKKYAMEQEDWPEVKPYEGGTKRGTFNIPRLNYFLSVADLRDSLFSNLHLVLSSPSNNTVSLASSSGP